MSQGFRVEVPWPVPEAPPRVRDGDIVGVVAPAGPVNPARLRQGIARLGAHLRLRVPDDIERRGAIPYLAGSDDERLAELHAMLADPDVRAIILARGGYGISRLLNRLDPALLRADPKPIVGFSDGTVLLQWAARAGVRGIHGPVVAQLGDLPDGDLHALVRALTDPAPPGRLTGLVATGARLHGPRGGRLVGGNVTMIAALVGTPWQIDLREAIVLLEEIGEKPYAIDRDLTQVIAGGLDHAAGALLGDFTRCTDPPHAGDAPDDPAGALAAADERLRHAGVPALRGAPIGHGARNLAVPWAARTVLYPDGSVEILDGAVA